MKQSSIRWLNDELGSFELGTSEFFSRTAIINHAERMHKEEIVNSWCAGYDEDNRSTSTPLQYYNETFN
jgi:hypothetical protein